MFHLTGRRDLFHLTGRRGLFHLTGRRGLFHLTRRWSKPVKMRRLPHLYKEVVMGAVSQIARDNKRMEVGEHGDHLPVFMVRGGW